MFSRRVTSALGAVSATVLVSVVLALAGGAPRALAVGTLSVTGQPISAQEGTAVGSPAVATFTDATPSPVGDYVASIAWGDGTITTGTVTGPDAGGVYTVTGPDHTYTDEGTFPMTVSVSESNGSDQDSGQATTTATISEGDAVTPSAVTITTSGGLPLTNVTVGSFTDTNPFQVAGGWTATIDWGDSTTSAGTVNGGIGGPFTVTGSHTYAAGGPTTEPVTVTLADDQPGTLSFQIFSSVAVLQANAPQPAPTVNEGGAFNGNIATFSDTNAADIASDFFATIDWGDGTISPGTVSGPTSGVVSVAGTHTYADEGTFPTVTTLTDLSTGASSTVVNPMTVAEGDFGALTPVTLTVASGSPLTNVVVGSFTDLGNPLQSAGDFTATIDWGDGTTSAGTVSGGIGGQFSISGSHTYSGPFTTLPITATFSDDLPSSLTGVPIASTADFLAPAPQPPTSVGEGAPFTGPVAAFFDPNRGDTAGSFAAFIDWGDGTTTTGTVTGPSGGSLSVLGSHVYADEGNFPVVVALIDTSTQALATVTNLMGVTESDVAVPSPVTLTEAAGAPLTDVAVGTFTDPGNPTQTAADWTATIDWGDGTTTPGTVSGPDAGGVFSVMGSHSYAAPAPATEPIIVTVTDDRPGTLSFPIFSTADLLAPTPTQPTITMPVGSPFGGSVATFSDANASDTTATFTATIDWGDGTTTPGTVTGPSGGVFTVSGTHTWSSPGPMPLGVTLTDTGPGGASATAHMTATVYVPSGGGGGGSTPPAATPSPVPPPVTPPAPTPPPPCPAGNDGFVCKAYNDLLHRPVDPAGMAFWTGFLNGGGSRVQMAQAILSSDEYHTDVVQGLYEALLHRPADPSGLALGVWLLGMGNRDEVVEAALLGSPEYFVTRGGSANAGFVTAIYQDLLHRTPDTAGLAFWQVQLGAGMSRTAVANALLLSPERDQDVVASDYQVFLHRPVDPAGSAFWAHELSTGLTDEEVIASVVGSDEYFARP